MWGEFGSGAGFSLGVVKACGYLYKILWNYFIYLFSIFFNSQLFTKGRKNPQRGSMSTRCQAHNNKKMTAKGNLSRGRPWAVCTVPKVPLGGYSGLFFFMSGPGKIKLFLFHSKKNWKFWHQLFHILEKNYVNLTKRLRKTTRCKSVSWWNKLAHIPFHKFSALWFSSMEYSFLSVLLDLENH